MNLIAIEAFKTSDTPEMMEVYLNPDSVDYIHKDRERFTIFIRGDNTRLQVTEKEANRLFKALRFASFTQY